MYELMYFSGNAYLNYSVNDAQTTREELPVIMHFVANSKCNKTDMYRSIYRYCMVSIYTFLPKVESECISGQL